MNTPAQTFGSPSGGAERHQAMLQQMCEKLWTLPDRLAIEDCRLIAPLAHGRKCGLKEERISR